MTKQNQWFVESDQQIIKEHIISITYNKNSWIISIRHLRVKLSIEKNAYELFSILPICKSVNEMPVVNLPNLFLPTDLQTKSLIKVY